MLEPVDVGSAFRLVLFYGDFDCVPQNSILSLYILLALLSQSLLLLRSNSTPEKKNM